MSRRGTMVNMSKKNGAEQTEKYTAEGTSLPACCDISCVHACRTVLGVYINVFSVLLVPTWKQLPLYCVNS